MPNKKRGGSQANREKKSLRRLRDLGLYTGKRDLRKAPTRHQKSLIAKYADVLAGRAAVVEPKNPKSYSNLYEHVGKKVIVPRRKGERITVNKKGEITGTRRDARGKTVRTRYRRTPVGEVPSKPGRRVQYAIPFIRGRDANGRAVLNWFRFPSWDAMREYMAGSASIRGYENWPDFVVEEFADEPQSDEALQSRLAERDLKVTLRESTDKWRRSKRRKRRRSGDDDDDE